jgi:hypothetical protein
VGVPERPSAALGFRHPLRHPFAKIGERLRADGELDEVKRHGLDYSRGGKRRPRRTKPLSP